jgi:hypothetical protein
MIDLMEKTFITRDNDGIAIEDLEKRINCFDFVSFEK